MDLRFSTLKKMIRPRLEVSETCVYGTDGAILSPFVVLCVCCGKSCASGCTFQYVGVCKVAEKGVVTVKLSS